MNRPPRPPDEGIFARGRGFFIIRFGLVIGISALFFQAFALKEGLPWHTMIFTALVIGRMAVVMGLRSEHDSLLKIGVIQQQAAAGRRPVNHCSADDHRICAFFKPGF